MFVVMGGQWEGCSCTAGSLSVVTFNRSHTDVARSVATHTHTHLKLNATADE